MRKTLLLVLAGIVMSTLSPYHEAVAAPPVPAQRYVHHPVSTANAEAQGQFDEGLFYIYAFNHDEAISHFKEALKLDPNLGMAYWGIALALGPNINLDADPPRQKAAFEALQKALALSPKLPEQEKQYIRALSARYTGKPDEDLHLLAVRYKDAMKALSARYPDDADAATLYAESLMDLHPWRLWTADGRPSEGTLELVSVLESVLRRRPAHIGANHYYIHAVEASPHPEWALPSADRLRAMQLPAGHLVHMPAHVYMRVGDYHAVSQSNEAAAAADERFMKASGEAGYYPMLYYNHNLHFLAVSAGIEGRYRDSIEAAQKLARHAAPKAAEVHVLEFFVTTPLLVMTRFHNWQEILQYPEPPQQLPLTRSVWHFARGVAFAATGNVQKARGERTVFLQHLAKIPPTVMLDVVKASDVVKVAQDYLDARIAMAEGNTAAAMNMLRKGIAAEDALPYMEPPGWYIPLREALGGLQLRKGQYVEAERTFREELAKTRRSGRALFGLEESLKAQGRNYEAKLVDQEFVEAWRYADTKLDIDSL